VTNFIRRADMLTKIDAALLWFWNRFITLNPPKDPNQPDIVLLEDRILYSASILGLMDMGDVSEPVVFEDALAQIESSLIAAGADSLGRPANSLDRSESQGDGTDVSEAAESHAVALMEAPTDDSSPVYGESITENRKWVTLSSLGLEESLHVVNPSEYDPELGRFEQTYRHHIAFTQQGMEDLDSLMRELEGEVTDELPADIEDDRHDTAERLAASFDRIEDALNSLELTLSVQQFSDMADSGELVRISSNIDQFVANHVAGLKNWGLTTGDGSAIIAYGDEVAYNQQGLSLRGRAEALTLADFGRRMDLEIDSSGTLSVLTRTANFEAEITEASGWTPRQLYLYEFSSSECGVERWGCGCKHPSNWEG
jgi:hypothetical protein